MIGLLQQKLRGLAAVEASIASRARGRYRPRSAPAALAATDANSRVTPAGLREQLTDLVVAGGGVFNQLVCRQRPADAAATLVWTDSRVLSQGTPP